jgi:hypothetical protein
VRIEHYPHKSRDHQVDHDTWEMALNGPSPPRWWCRVRRPIYRPQIRFHDCSPPPAAQCFTRSRQQQVQPVNAAIIVGFHAVLTMIALPGIIGAALSRGISEAAWVHRTA